MADEAAVVEEDISPAQSPLVTLSFQRNDTRKQKYLEAEPKALGVVIAGSVAVVALNLHLPTLKACLGMQIVACIASIVNMFIAEIKMEVETYSCWNHYNDTVDSEDFCNQLRLKACLGMQIVACGASIVNMVCALIKMEVETYSCWRNYHPYNDTFNGDDLCYEVRKVHLQFYAESALVQVALFAISVTLAVYCCKVVNCCAPAPKMPVITVQASPTQQ
ncbi:uncharacterized protein LOC114844764 isoform X2 [Betta splendens]|uniref:Uncharacterized protein LOC114844764 isoform X2 n=1 Tax=Betta splendens TaxID=158456 RepID=A0A9W2XDK0_BETSP|nr:uncharacterized protein LOC114844764 isoform X2 [Betta splendens]